MTSDGRECGWMGCRHPRCDRVCDGVSLAEWQDWKAASMASQRWTLSPKRGDRLRRLRCTLTGHDWVTNPRATQRVCYRCWTVWDLL